jgi:hypothetical protein
MKKTLLLTAGLLLAGTSAGLAQAVYAPGYGRGYAPGYSYAPNNGYGAGIYDYAPGPAYGAQDGSLYSGWGGPNDEYYRSSGPGRGEDERSQR